LTDSWNCNFGLSFLPEVSEQEKNTSEPFLAGVEKLVNKILFVLDVPRQQICDEQIGKGVFPVKRVHHGLFLNSQNSAICHCGCSAHAERLTCKRTFAEETSITQYPDRGFFAGFGNNGQSHLAALQIKHCVREIPLRENGLLFRKEQSLPALADGGKECLRVELPGAPKISTWTRRILRSLGYPMSRRLADAFR
jgi:hypothetical protein